MGKHISAAVIILLLFFGACTLRENDRPAGYALIYGVSEYSIAPDLTLTRNDADAMARLFTEQGYEVLLRIDNDYGVPASLEQLKSDIDYVKTVITADDNFVFYFSGHGGRHLDFYGEYSDPPGNEGPGSDPDDEWLFFYGSLPSLSFEDWGDTAVSDDILADLLAGIPTPKKVIIIDACNAGGFIGTSPDIDRVPSNYEWEEQTVKEGIFSQSFSLYMSYPDAEETDIPYHTAYVLGAAGEREYSWENSGIQHGIFTYYFLQSPLYADTNRDGGITLDEVYRYTSEQITTNWNAEFSNPVYHYHPHLTGGAVTFSLLTAEGTAAR